MIIGEGDIAKVLPKRNDLLFFASGVSNSQETRATEYKRERDLLLEQDRYNHIVYFSSLSVFYLDTPYSHHKRAQEELIKEWFQHYTIIRLGNISWGKNPHTLINYFRAHPNAEVQDVYRYVIDKDEFLHWISLIPQWSCEMNCPGRKLKVEEIVKQYV